MLEVQSPLFINWSNSIQPVLVQHLNEGYSQLTAQLHPQANSYDLDLNITSHVTTTKNLPSEYGSFVLLDTAAQNIMKARQQFMQSLNRVEALGGEGDITISLIQDPIYLGHENYWDQKVHEFSQTYFYTVQKAGQSYNVSERLSMGYDTTSNVLVNYNYDYRLQSGNTTAREYLYLKYGNFSECCIEQVGSDNLLLYIFLYVFAAVFLRLLVQAIARRRKNI